MTATGHRRPRALVLRALGLGDFCTAVPALRALRSAYPDHELVLAAPAWQVPLARMVAVERVTATAALAPVSNKEAEPAVAVNLHGRGPQSTRALLDLAPGRLITYRHPVLPDTDGSPRWFPDEHEVGRWCRLLEAHGIPADPGALALPAPTTASLAPDHVLVHPGAASGARRWPPRRFAAVIAHLVSEGVHVALTGTVEERALVDEVIACADPARRGPIVNLCGRTTVEELCATVAGARAVVCNDTGVAHLSYAFGVPSVVLFGPTSPARWGPPPSGPHLALWKGSSGDPHAARLDAGLAAISTTEVLRATDQLLRQVAV